MREKWPKMMSKLPHLEHLDGLDCRRGQQREIVGVEVGYADMLRLAGPFGGLERRPHRRSLGAGLAPVVEEEEINVRGVELRQLVVDIALGTAGIEVVVRIVHRIRETDQHRRNA